MGDRSGQLLGQYRVIRLLGRGGFAEVYLGEHRYLKTQVAIKMLQAPMTSGDDLESFLKEARLLAHLVHPHLVRVLDFGVSGQTPYLVMDYAPHGTLRARHPRGVPVPVAAVLSYLQQMASALQYAHDERVIHRDVKPENMLVGRNGEILLADFGLALLAQRSRSQSTQGTIGTAAYMAPEQIQGHPCAASDQYALGMVIYEWLSGDHPFHGSFSELCAQHLFAPLPPLRAKQPAIPSSIEQVVMTVVAKDPKQRFDSLRAFAAAFERTCISPQPVVLAPPSALPSDVPVSGALPALPQPIRLPHILSSWRLPDISLFHLPARHVKEERDQAVVMARLLEETLRRFRVYAEVREEDIGIGPTAICFGLRPTGKPEMRRDKQTGDMVPVRDAAGNIIYETRTRVSRIMALEHDLVLALEAESIRMEEPGAGRPYVRLELARKDRHLVSLRELLESKEYQASRARSRLAWALGRDVAGRVRVGDLATAHLLIAGEPESGKSTLVKTLLASLLTQATPDDVRLLLFDPNTDTLSLFSGVPHLLAPVMTTEENVVPLLKNALHEMERRYRLFTQLHVRNQDGYRKLRLERIGKGDTSLTNVPAIVMVLNDLIESMRVAAGEVREIIDHLAHRGQLVGIHLVVIARPSREAMARLMKAPHLTRLCLKVRTSADSRTILGADGAERLLGRGDLLSLPVGESRPERVQAAFLSDEEATALADYWQRQGAAQHRSTDPNATTQPTPQPGWEMKETLSDEVDLDDALLGEAEAVVREYGRASISLLQRRLRIGYSRASRLIKLLEEQGIIGPVQPAGYVHSILEKKESAQDQHASEHAMEEQARQAFLRREFVKGDNDSRHTSLE